MRMTTLLATGAMLTSILVHADGGNAQYILPASGLVSQPLTYSKVEGAIMIDLIGDRTLKFVLPDDLVGLGKGYELKSKGTTGAFTRYSNDKVSASCTWGDFFTTCVLHYHVDSAQDWDIDALISHLNGKYSKDPALLAIKLEDSDRFIRDPQGVLILPNQD